MSTTSVINESKTQESMRPWDTKQSQHGRDGNLAKRLAGTYFLWEQVDHDDQIYFRLVTLMADGTWVSSHAYQHSRDFGFTIQQGVWEAIGPHAVSARVLDFNYNPVSGDPTGISKMGFIMQWREDYREVHGNMYGERYRLDQNPLDADEVSKDNFYNSFTGRRLMHYE